LLGDDDEERILEQEELIANKVVIVEDYETWMEKENKRREERRINERLILAVRRLYAMKEVTSAMAKFWEGMLGNKKHRQFAEKELIYSMRTRPIVIIPGMNEVGDGSVSGSSAVPPQLNPFVFPSVAKRELLYEAMYARNTSLLRAYLSHHHGVGASSVVVANSASGSSGSMSLGLNSSTGGQAYVYANRLLNEIGNMQQNFINLKRLCRSYAELGLVEDYLLQCAKLAYTGPEMYAALELRQEILVTTSKGSSGSSKHRALLNQEFPLIQCKAMITNLLLSREWEKLREKIQEVAANPLLIGGNATADSATGITSTGSIEEVNVAKSMLQEYDRVIELLKSAMQTAAMNTGSIASVSGSFTLHNMAIPGNATSAIDTLDQALAIAAFHNIYPPDNLIEQSLRVLENQARNPARLLKVIVEGLRNNDIHQVERGFEECMKMGLHHEALDAVICSKIHAIKNKIIQVSSFFLLCRLLVDPSRPLTSLSCSIIQ
jgi:hypothetical protein